MSLTENLVEYKDTREGKGYENMCANSRHIYYITNMKILDGPADVTK